MALGTRANIWEVHVRLFADTHLATAAAGGLAVAAYLDGRYSLMNDAKAILKAKKAERIYAQKRTVNALTLWPSIS